MPKYKIVAGKHIQRTNGVQTLYGKDDVIESNDAMIARDTKKFMLVDPMTKVSPGQPTGKASAPPAVAKAEAPPVGGDEAGATKAKK